MRQLGWFRIIIYFTFNSAYTTALDMLEVARLLPERTGTPRAVAVVRLCSSVLVLMLDHVYFLREPLGTILAFKCFEIQVVSFYMSTQPIRSLINFPTP